MKEKIITVANLSKVYHTGEVETVALDDVSFDIKRGEYVAIMGPSGSGKSTLMHILGALDSPTAGTYQLDGVNVEDLTEDELAEIRNRKIGFVFQFFNLLPRTTALKNVSLPMMYAGFSPVVRESKARAALAAVGLSDRVDFTSRQLSGGQQQRVAIARALVMNPAIILADEPTGNIASAQAEEVMRLFEELHEKGHTLIMITHEADIAEHTERILHLLDGRLVKDERKRREG